MAKIIYIYHIFILFIYFIKFISCNVEKNITITESGYYNVTQVNIFEKYSNIKPTSDLPLHYDYYPNICYGENVLKSMFSGVFEDFMFSGDISGGSIVRIESDHVMDAYVFAGQGKVDIVCIAGTLNVLGTLSMAGYLILPGGKMIVNGEVTINLNKLLNPKLEDPYKHFPGILNLGGEFTYNGIFKYFTQATVIESDKIMLKDNIDPGTSFGMIAPNIPIEILFGSKYNSTTGVIQIFQNYKFQQESIGKDVFIFSGSTYIAGPSGEASVFMSGNSKVTLKNVFFMFKTTTTNDIYNDTTLEFSSNDTSVATKVNLGGNQRFRGLLNLQFVQDAVIDGCVFGSINDTRSPISLFASSLNISNSFISGKSGSNIIAQYGTELIYSQNNHYYLQEADISPQQVPPASSMDYGYEGNGIYSLSPNISSTNDVFYGQKNAIHFNFISNRSSITGLDKDCYLPCTSESSGVSNSVQYPIEFKINNPTFYQLDTSRSSTLKQYLIRINNNGNLPSRIFTIKDLELSTPISIFANLQDSTLLLDNIKSSNDFSIDGSITKLQIQNSKFNSSSNNNAVILSTSIQNTLFSGKLKDINIPTNQNYGSISTPYLYSNEETSENITINSIYPSTPYQMNINTTLNIKVSFTTPLDISSFQCIFGNSINGEINETFSYYTSLLESECQFEFKPRNEGIYNLFIIIRSDDNDYYTIAYPKIYVFPRLDFYSGLYFSSISNSALQANMELNEASIEENIVTRCIKPNCSIEESNLKYSSLPNTELEGVTTNDQTKPIEIQFLLNSTSLNYQIQLSFVYYQAIDEYGSPLSIYMNDEPILVLETFYQESTFNNITFYYNNLERLSYANLKIQNRGDIYLTSIVVYSLDNPIVVTDPPTPTPTSTTEPTTKPILPTNEKDDLLLVKSIPPSVGTFIIVCIILYLLMRKFKWSIKALVSSYYYKHLGDEGTKVSFDPADYDNYQTHSEVLAYLHGSKFCFPSTETFPLLLSTTRLDFGQNGGLSSLNSILHDRLTLTNKFTEPLKYLLILPPYSKSIICSSSKLYGTLKPGESVEIILTLTLFCTAFFFEKIALFVEGHGHTFICINVQSNLSQLLDIQDFEFGSILGEGSSSVVYKCKWRGEDTAVKIINFGYSKSLSREIELIKKIKHPNVVTFLGTISNFKYLCIVTEHAGYGSLHSILYKTAIKLTLIQKLNIAINIAKGCSFLHQSKIIHRDLKPSNILVFSIEDSGVCAKISDFGSSREISSNDSPMTAYVGTTVYMSNQVLEKKRYNYLTDIYSFGISLYELMAEVIPYSEMDLSWSLPKFIVSGGRPSKDLEIIHEELIDIIVYCWSSEEHERPQFKEIIRRMERLYNKLIDRRDGKPPTEAELEEEISLKKKADIHIQNLLAKNQKIRENIFNERFNGKESSINIGNGKESRKSIEMKEMASSSVSSSNSNNSGKEINNSLSIDIKALSDNSTSTSKTKTLTATTSNKMGKILNDVEYLFKYKEGESNSNLIDDGFLLFLNGEEIEKSRIENKECILEIQKKEKELQTHEEDKEIQITQLLSLKSKLQVQIQKQPNNEFQEKNKDKNQKMNIQEEQEILKKRNSKKNMVFVSNAQLKEGDIYGINESSSFKFERTPSNEKTRSTFFDYIIKIPTFNKIYLFIKRYQNTGSIQTRNKFKNQLQYQHQLKLQNKNRNKENESNSRNQDIYNIDYVINPKVGHLLKQLAKTTKIELQIIDQSCSNITEYNYIKNENIQIGYIPNKEPIKVLPGIKSFQKYGNNNKNNKNSLKSNDKSKLKPITFIENSPLESHPPYFNISTRRKYDEYLKAQLYHYITKNKNLECNSDLN